MGKKGGKGGKAGKSGLPAFIPRPPACLPQLTEENFDIKKAEEETQSIQTRLREILIQVWDENAIFQRIMYKNQNQHRRTVYFRRLMQVRRDLSLLESFQLNDVVEALSHCVSFSKAALPKVVLGQGVESKDQLVSIIQRRLLGAARLLQMMADPLLNAGLAIEGLLSQSFFMPFALTVLALLARFRMLLIKALYEMITAFNLVSAFMHKTGVPSVRADVPLLLECKWDGVKLIFFEKAPPPQELVPLPSSLSDAAKLPDVGWFIDDRSTSAVPKPLIYEREENFILEESEFELLGEDVAAVPSPAMEVKTFSGIQEIAQSFSTDAVFIPSSSKEAGVSVGKQKLAAQGLRLDERAKLESWKAELESWGSTKKDKKTKKRVAYVSVQLGGANKESKLLNTGHPR